MQLSPRELQIATLLQQGLTNKEIGQAIGISPNTVRDYISPMLQRYGVSSRTALIAIFAPVFQAPPARPRPADRRAGSERRAKARIASHP